jgi:hypothetical protein
MSLLRVLDELDETQRLLEEAFPECKIGYSYQPGRVTWSAQVGPLLNEDSPEALRESIKRAYAELLEKIGEQTQGASSAAAEASYDPVAQP